MLKLIVICVLLCCITFVYAEENDSTEVVPDSSKVVIDSSKEADSTDVLSDTLTEAQRAYQQFLDRQQQRQDEKVEQIKERKPYLSIYDSLVTYFSSEKLNQRKNIERSYNRDAGDYFKYSSSYFTTDYLLTPMRKTVQPFGLSGNRTNVIHNGSQLSPFEHVIEPTGLIDYNDVPSALDDQVYLLPSGAGQIFGGEQSVATLLTVPKEPDSTIPESYFKVDKGPYDYSHTRGKYAKRFTSGKEIDFSLEYRSTSGIKQFITDDNAYLYTGRVMLPINETYSVTASGNTMRRDGSYIVSVNEIGGSSRTIDRFRTDRSFDVGIEKQNEAKTVKHHLAYLNSKKNSNLNTNYRGRFNYFSDGVRFERESVRGNSFLQLKSSYQHHKFTDGIDDFTRDVSRGAFVFGKVGSSSRVAFTAGAEYIRAFDMLPFASLLYLKESEKSLLMFTSGYSEKAPSLYELNLKQQEQAVYSGATDYADEGNSELVKEKQLTASVTTRFGSEKNNILMSLTGGKIFDGIDWHATDTVLSLTTVRYFHPQNGDVTFADISVTSSFSFLRYFTISSGGAYHLTDYDAFDIKAYDPEYQIFAGGEIHYYWAQKWMDLYAYAEIVYSGPYRGYSNELLGETAVINTGLSFEIKNFRFHYIFLNSLQQYHENHEDLNIIGRYQYYGFTWKFFD